MIKKLLFVFIFILVISTIDFTNIYADANEDRTVYLSATEYDYPPFSVTDSGEADGFSVQLLKAVAQEMGITVTFKIDQWTTLKEELRLGELDILPLVGFTPERDLIYDFTVPYIVMRGNIFVRKGETAIQSEADLFGKEILVLDGDNSQEWAWSIGLAEELTPTLTYAEAFDLLASGQYDAVLAQGLVGEKLIYDNGLTNIEPVYIYEDGGATRLKLNLEGYEQKFCFAVVEGDSELLSLLNEGLLIVSANGTYDELYHQWFPFLVEQHPVTFIEIFTYVAIILGPILILLLVFYVIAVRRSIRLKTEQIEKNSYGNKIIIEAFQKEFISASERYDYVLHELVKLTESESGFIFSINDRKKFEFKTCLSMSQVKPCDHQLLFNIINQNQLIQKSINTKQIVLSNDYKEDYPNSTLTICDQEVFRLISLPIVSYDRVNVIVLINKKQAFSDDNVNQTSILMTGLWTMIEREEHKEKIEYMSFHDSLTGLYNRRFFEEEMQRIDNPRNYPITIAMGDVNGLKLINDAFGHHTGDELLINIGKLLKKYSRSNDVAARWGGDEFIIILPNTSLEDSRHLLERINSEATKMVESYGLTSIAFGLDSKTDSDKSLREVFKNAEDLMYENKLEIADSSKGESIKTVLDTLFNKSPRIKKHSERVSDIAVAIATKMNLSKNKIADIKTIGVIHDIGKVNIDEAILNTTHPLTEEQKSIIKKHSLSGSKLLSYSPEYTRLASGVLHHHERWDGKGYPNGIKGDSIPIESRIISIADAFDGLTNENSSGESRLTTEQAVKEILKNKGTQFDPDIVDVLLTIVDDIK